MLTRNRILRGGLTFCVMLVVAVAGSLGATVQAQAPAPSLPGPADLELSPLVAAAGETSGGVKPTPQPRPAANPRSSAPNVFSREFPAEVEPNGVPATATPLTFNAGGYVQIQGNVFPVADVDWYSFTAQAGDRIYAAAMTSATASTSTDAQLRVFASDGTTLIEFDDDDGSFGTLAPSIANATLPTAGTYYLQVKQFDDTNTIRPYFLHARLQSGAPTPEVEANDTPATANPLPANGWVSGTRNPAAATEQDWYSFTANAGDTVFLSLDVDPERDNVQWDGRLGIALFGDAGNQILVVNDASTGSATNPLSEAMFMTVKTSGTYFAFVDSASAAVGGPTATYTLSVSVAPPPTPEPTCTTYTSTDVPKTIGPGTGLVSSVITVPGNPVISDVDVDIVLNHALMQDIDAHLRSPAGNDIGLFTDIGAAATGGQQQMDVVYDDEAAITPTFTAFKGTRLKPESPYRLSWLDGENAGGTWTLDLRDDVAGANGGTLTSWSLRICEAPPPPACPPGFGPQTVYSTDFESGAAGFTHSGTADEWELGLPATVATTTATPVAAFNTCASGVNCWKTDLDNTYDATSSQDLVSPAINLAGLSAPVVVSWSQRYQMETASNDHYSVDFRQVGGATPVRMFEWLDGTMIDAVGNPAVNIGASAGWGRVSARADALAGLNSELVFHLDSNGTVNYGGAAIDDVTVTACRALVADLSITKTDGVTTVTPGGSATYTITASNAGPDPVTGATVADTFPAVETCTWTCVGAGGGTCTAAGSGNISDATNLPVGGSVTYTATCAVNASATGTLSNTATVSSTISDPNPANNSATDTDTLTPNADLAITKTDGVTTATPGGSVTYTITASNAGLSNAPGSTIADTFPASLTCTWTCVGAGGGTCTAAGSGNISDTANLPAGGSVTYTATCAVSAAASGTLSNTATVAAPAGVTDPTPGNNSATDTDTLTPQADLSITKTDGVASVTAGGSTTYTITAANAGPSNATGATVADTFPASLTCTWTCVGAGGGTCTASGSGNINSTANLPAGGSATYTASCTVSAGATGSLSNTATVAAPGGVTDPNPANNSATDTDTILVPAAVSGTKTVSGTFSSGGTVTYTVTLSNTGGAQADNPGNEFTDVLPAQLTLVSATATSGTASTAGNTATWNGTIPSGGSVTITITATINAGASGSVSNQGTISYDSNGDGTNDATATTDDPGTGAANDPTTFGITPTADLSITKTDGVTSVTAGGSTTYTIVATNTGPNSITGATVADTFPASLTCTWTCAGSDGGTCTGSGSGNIADTVNLPFGAAVTYTAVCAINGSATGTLSNTATVAVPAGAIDPTPGNNSATDTDTIVVPAAVTGTKTVSGTFLPNGTVTYTIVLNNAGGAAQGDNPGNEFSDVLPASLTLVSANATSGTAVASVATNTVTWNGPVPAGGSVTITITATVNASATGTISNQGTIAYDADNNGTNESNGVTDDPGTGVAGDPTSFALGAAADLVVTKTDGLTAVVAGTSSTYTITVGNLGPSAITGATVTDTFPAECTAPTWTCTATGGGTCPPGGSGAIAASVDLPVSAMATFTATCPVGAAVPTGTVITNTATAAVPVGASDPNPANNSATDTTTVSAGPSASVSGTKTAAGAFVAGGTVTYTIVLTNAGLGAQADNPGDEFSDVLPSQLTLVSATATSGTAVANVGTNTVTWNGTIAPAGTVTIAITATINAGATGTVSNQGQIFFDNDANGTNNATVTTDDPGVGGPADSTDFVVGGPVQIVPVPGLTPFGLALLAIGLAFAGARRRRYG
ncbi:pre-peptidase C-terminal domain-containing protein [Tahibacter soli]|uniref:Pre-peptidase C-terminal domain-containing protein n=1 Tax=Tahibacter soli TaxID=2983605 RepID=A0A9X3YQC2_9GAMM|nr:pre-peptidase C-terminal domain-containing protein [Tahibacter soli]MDC8015550.1 pre-peptidase C-terminal domain-containing protein [Tahibacter soli]